VGMLRCEENGKESSFQSLVNPRRPISPKARLVHGITDEMVADAPTFDRIAGELLDFIGDSVIVAHNAPFDLGFLAFQFKGAGISPPDNFAVDTLQLAREHFNFPSNSLPNIASYLGINLQESHRALQDASTVKQVFESFIRDFGGRRKQTGRTPGTGGRKVILSSIAGNRTSPEIDEALKGSGKLRIRYMSGGVQKP